MAPGKENIFKTSVEKRVRKFLDTFPTTPLRVFLFQPKTSAWKTRTRYTTAKVTQAVKSH